MIDGQAADAFSAYTHIKMEDDPRLLRIPRSECPDVWIRLPSHKWPKSWMNIEDPVVPLERNLYGHLLDGQDNQQKFYHCLDREQCRIGNVYLFIKNKNCSYRRMWMTAK